MEAKPGRPLRIGLELTGLELDTTGSGRYARELRRELASRPDVELREVSQPGIPGKGRAGRALRGLARELTWFPVRLPRRAGRMDLDMLHCPVPLVPLRSPVPLAVTVHDAMAFEHPEWLRRANVLQQRSVLRRGLARAALVLTVSEYSRERIVEVLDVEPDRVVVTPNGVGEEFSPGAPDPAVLSSLGVEGPFILTVGTLQPRKNLATALRAFERIADRFDHRLVVVGARGWGDDELLARLRDSPVGERILALGRVSEAELLSLYRAAECFVFPSLYEGFGMPVLEAMACGTPVVCSERTAVPEVAGVAAVLVEPRDPGAIAAALADVLGFERRRVELSRAGLARAMEFSWSRCAELTVEAYRRALSSPAPRSSVASRQ